MKLFNGFMMYLYELCQFKRLYQKRIKSNFLFKRLNKSIKIIYTLILVSMA